MPVTFLARGVLVDLNHLDLIVATEVFAKRLLGEDRAIAPLLALNLAPEIFKYVCVCGEELRAPAERFTGVKFSNLKLEKSLLGLAKVEPCTRHRDRQLHSLLGFKFAQLGSETGLNATLWAAKRTLALNHEGKMPLRAGEATEGTKLAQSEGVITDVVSGDGEGLTRHRDAPCATTRRDCVLMCEFWVVAEQHAGHGEVLCNALGGLRLQRLQFVAGTGVQIFRRDVFRNKRIVMLAAHRPQLVLQALSLSELATAATAVTLACATGATTAKLRAIPLSTRASIKRTIAVTLRPAVVTALTVAARLTLVPAALTVTANRMIAVATVAARLAIEVAVALTARFAVKRTFAVTVRPTIIAALTVATRLTVEAAAALALRGAAPKVFTVAARAPILRAITIATSATVVPAIVVSARAAIKGTLAVTLRFASVTTLTVATRCSIVGAFAVATRLTLVAAIVTAATRCSIV